MSTKEILILIGGGLHFLTLIASAMVPKTLDWKGELAKLIPFLRTLFWVYGIFIVLCIVSFGVISFVNYRALAGGTTLEARSICAFISIFLGSPINHRIVLLRRQRISDKLVSQNWVPHSEPNVCFPNLCLWVLCLSLAP